MAYSGLMDAKSQYSYSGKSKVIYSRGLKRRSDAKSVSGRLSEVGPYQDKEDARSHLSKTNVARFNEDVETKSKAPSLAGSMKKSVFSQKSVGKMSGVKSGY